MRMHRSATGLTLIEMLVVFVFMALLSVLVVQGIAFFMGNYQSVVRAVQGAEDATRQGAWFETTLQGMVASRHPSRRFRGTAQAFEGQTLQPLSAESGVPVHIRWSLSETDSGAALTYSEVANDVSWTVSTHEPSRRRAPSVAETSELAFQYADRAGNWQQQWPPDWMNNELLPYAVKLVSSGEETVWLVPLDLDFRPIILDEDYL